LIWPASDPEAVPHTHDNLAPGDPHLSEGHAMEGQAGHAHPYFIDERHHRWPKTRG
jgi:hypothetical protein